MKSSESKSEKQEEGVYYLRIYDNYHYMDEDEAYTTGPYIGAEAVLSAAKAVVDRYFGGEGESLSGYKMFGDDPVIVGSPHVAFSAWSYAAERYGKKRRGQVARASLQGPSEAAGFFRANRVATLQRPLNTIFEVEIVDLDALQRCNASCPPPNRVAAFAERLLSAPDHRCAHAT